MNSPQEVAQFLRSKVPLFSEFPEARLAELVFGSRVTEFAPDQPIVHRGSEVTHLGVVLEGSARATVTVDGGLRQEVAKLSAGETFGELALMTGVAMPVDLVAVSACRVLFIPLSLVQSVIIAVPSAVKHISRTIAERLRRVAVDPSIAAVLQQDADPYGLSLRGERPEKLLVINCGSSSLKYTFYDTADEGRQARGQVERIGLEGTRHTYRGPKGELKEELKKGSYADAFGAMSKALTAPGTGMMASASEVTVVAHRVVHGAERFSEAVPISDEVLQQIEELNPLAPLHNPVNVAGIREMRRLMPEVPHIAVFDTAFHHTLPDYAYLYGLPYELYEQAGVRRYGFHGPSHAYVGLRTAQYLGRRPNELALVSCHLGNGSSVCAIDHGRSVDTSMGFTPTEGLIMGTRSGDVDPGVLSFLERTRGLSAVQSEEMLNKKSGLLGISGVASDMREVLKAADAGDPRALVAVKAYCYRVRKYIGAYVAAMGGLDAVVFTGGIGQGSEAVRALALQGLDRMGIQLDEPRNRTARGFDEVSRISTDDSKVAVLVVPADEERMMAREALRVLGRARVAQALHAQKPVPFLVEVSAHHVHLSQEHVEALFGKGHKLTPHSDLSQPGQYACKEQVNLIGPKGRVDRVRVLGPARSSTQVEIAMTEQFKLGVHPPIRESGDIAGTPGCTLEGTAGTVTLDRGVICALRHIHMTPEDALRYGVRDKMTVRVRIPGDRELVFGDVLVRVSPSYALAMHIDTDEANAANLQTGAQGYLEGIQG
jgi:acetate kinase